MNLPKNMRLDDEGYPVLVNEETNREDKKELLYEPKSTKELIKVVFFPSGEKKYHDSLTKVINNYAE